MLYCFLGRKRSGKTLLMTKFLLDYAARGYEINANYKLYGVKYNYFTDIPENPNEFLAMLKNKISAFDEFQFWLNSRSSARKKNKYAANATSLSGHVHSHLFYTTQSLFKVDVIIRNETNYIIVPRKIIRGAVGKPEYVLFRIYDCETGLYKTRVADVRGVCDRYDTHEILNIPYEDD